ncbi:MAG: hypothetical protein F6K31_18515 [Symploca sp. SIO2G7]|nr:hypothetical protein [Symploca sp. SIO2G7]
MGRKNDRPLATTEPYGAIAGNEQRPNAGWFTRQQNPTNPKVYLYTPCVPKRLWVLSFPSQPNLWRAIALQRLYAELTSTTGQSLPAHPR